MSDPIRTPGELHPVSMYPIDTYVRVDGKVTGKVVGHAMTNSTGWRVEQHYIVSLDQEFRGELGSLHISYIIAHRDNVRALSPKEGS